MTKADDLRRCHMRDLKVIEVEEPDGGTFVICGEYCKDRGEYDKDRKRKEEFNLLLDTVLPEEPER